MTRAIRRHYKAAGAVRDVDLSVHEGRLTGHVDGTACDFDATVLRRLDGGAELAVVVPGDAHAAPARAVVVRDGDTVHVAFGGRTYRFQSVQPRPGGDAARADLADPFAASPMTGLVRKVLVAPGDAASSGATLVVVEAMKMEFAVTAPRDVVIDEVKVAEGARVEIQQVLVTFRETAAAVPAPAAVREDRA